MWADPTSGAGSTGAAMPSTSISWQTVPWSVSKVNSALPLPEFRGFHGTLRCLARPLAPEGAEFRGNGHRN
jgi:hypothetical protein